MKLEYNISEDDKTVIASIVAAAKKSKTAFISMHARPDGDAIGGVLAISSILESLGIEVEIISSDPSPEVYNFLKGIDKIKTNFSYEKKDIGFILDCSDKKRLEGFENILDYADKIINIDHHLWNHEFGDINYIRPHCSSTCELIFNIANEMGIELNYDFALCIYLGIMTDTNRFQEDNTTPYTHLIASYLIEKFISPVKVSSLVYGSYKENALHLIAKAIDTMTLSESKRIGYITISPDMLMETGTDMEDLEGLINYARNVQGVEVGILFREMPESGSLKVSFRSKGNVDVSKIAGCFGGGGHHNAAGCLIKGDINKARKTIIDLVEKELS